MTNYTTLKLTEAQVQALVHALNIYDLHTDNYDQDERDEFGYTEGLKGMDQILTKLRKSGWNV